MIEEIISENKDTNEIQILYVVGNLTFTSRQDAEKYLSEQILGLYYGN